MRQSHVQDFAVGASLGPRLARLEAPFDYLREWTSGTWVSYPLLPIMTKLRLEKSALGRIALVPAFAGSCDT
jgi:hypothetical protein